MKTPAFLFFFIVEGNGSYDPGNGERVWLIPFSEDNLHRIAGYSSLFSCFWKEFEAKRTRSRPGGAARLGRRADARTMFLFLYREARPAEEFPKMSGG